MKADGASYQIDYKSIVRAALMYGTWYYTGSTCADNCERITYNPTDPHENIPTIDGQFNTLSFCWYCVVSLKDEAGDGLNLRNLGFENFYERIGNTLFHVGPSHTCKQLKIVSQGLKVLTIFPILSRWNQGNIPMTSVMATLQTMQLMLLGNVIPPHYTDNIQTAIWFLKEVADAAQNAGLLLGPNGVLEVSQLKVA